ncbi:MAG: lipoate--protein ligase family protein [Spirochaetae bacterium HGW-Spirochaetae-9]|nr:MAG: lipoate--protein ligase family protein [Spirochaetae bacterium HGW-Spirochaetae-9]
MKHPFRVLQTGLDSAYFNMGLDEAILESVTSGSALPTLRFYGWKPPAISLGYFQGALEEVDTDACRQQGVDVVRRITGGGAVFHDTEVTYSIVIPGSHPLAPASILDSYALLCSGIVEGLKNLNIDASFAPINDIVAGGRKISGNAQTRKKGCLLQHGTVLLKVDVEKMFGLLKVPKEKAMGKMIDDVKARVTSLSALLGRDVGFEEASDALREGFLNALLLDPAEGEPSPRELAAAELLARTKFSTEAWIFRR